MPKEQRYIKVAADHEDCDGSCEECSEDLEGLHVRDRKERICYCKTCAEGLEEEPPPETADGEEPEEAEKLEDTEDAEIDEEIE